jgi:hypothetical protein
MIVWGGDGGAFYLNSGGRYNPSADTWTATSTGGNVPPVRSDHSAVWTGTEMIAWGGSDKLGVRLDTGGRYDPVSNTWTATSLVGAPSKREYHGTPSSRPNHPLPFYLWEGTQPAVTPSSGGPGERFGVCASADDANSASIKVSFLTSASSQRCGTDDPALAAAEADRSVTGHREGYS